MKTIRYSVAAFAALALVGASAFAQGGGQAGGAGGAAGGGRQGGGAGGGRQGGGRQGGFGGMFGGPQEVSLATASASALATALKLTPEQKTQIGEIQQALKDQSQQQMQEMRQSFQPGGDPAAMQEVMTQIQEKRKSANGKASKAIEALLTDDQKTSWPAVKTKWEAFQKAGLSIDLGEALMLTPEQMKAMAEYAKTRPAGGQGGFGRGGGN